MAAQIWREEATMSEDRKTAREKFSTMRRFIDEYQYSVGVRGFTDLPDPAKLPYPNITLPRADVIRFRNDYRLALEFAALMCGKPIEELSPFDMLAPFLRMMTEEEKEPR
jgi:hypothetical protein